MKLTNQFRTMRGIFYVAVILSCFAFTSAKSAPLKFSSANNIDSSIFKVDRNKTINK